LALQLRAGREKLQQNCISIVANGSLNAFVGEILSVTYLSFFPLNAKSSLGFFSHFVVPTNMRQPGDLIF
jgi:hypothetical protein